MMTDFDLQPVLHVVLVAIALFAAQRAVPPAAKWLVRRRTAQQLAAASKGDHPTSGPVAEKGR